MSTFGEIAEPSTRTAWEEWDEPECPTNIDNELKWQRNLTNPEKINLLFIFEGKYLSNCVKTQKDYDLEHVNSVPDVNLNLYKVKTSSQFVCTIRDYNIVRSSEIVELLKDYLCISDNVVTIQTKPLAEYQSTALGQDCVIRSICTSKPPPSKYGFPKLEQPNMISGVSAGAICLREHLDLTGVAFVCYIECPEDYEVEGLQTLLKNLNIIHTTKNLKQSNLFDSNLYI